jgi:superfamily I DNA and/or RNA helicase
MTRRVANVAGVMRPVHSAIVDEAGSVSESHITLMFQLNAANMLLVGDPKQLPPYAKFEDPHLRHSVSLLERAEECGLRTNLLDTQYRMSRSMCSLVSRMFYDGVLHHADDYHPRFAQGGVTDLCWYNVNGGEYHHIDRVHGQAIGYSNRREVRACFQLAQSLREDNPEARIYILSFYRKQEEELLRHQEEHPELSDVVNHIGTIDSAQGDEADFVILTLAKSSGPTTFLSNPRRLCVALSRGRTSTIIVGNRNNFRPHDMWMQINAEARRIEPFAHLAEYDAEDEQDDDDISSLGSR